MISVLSMKAGVPGVRGDAELPGKGEWLMEAEAAGAVGCCSGSASGSRN